ncbi:MAG: Panacea domain-containing protein [Prevotella sp.]
MKYGVEDVARYVLLASDKANHPASNLRLQKLLYFIDGYYMAMHQGKSDLFREDFLAWTYGPVVRQAYTLFVNNGADKIPENDYTTKVTARFDDSNKRIVFDSSPWEPNMIENNDKLFIDKLVSLLGRHNDSALVDISHDPKGPWKKYYDGYSSSVIPKKEIYEYFRCLLGDKQ